MFYSFIYSGAYCDRTWAQCSLQPLGDGQQQEFKRFTIVNIRWFHNQCTSVPDQAQMSPLGKGNKTIILYRNTLFYFTSLFKVIVESAGMYALFLKVLGHQGIFSLVKGTQFKDTKAMPRGHGGKIVPLLPRWSIRHEVLLLTTVWFGTMYICTVARKQDTDKGSGHYW